MYVCMLVKVQGHMQIEFLLHILSSCFCFIPMEMLPSYFQNPLALKTELCMTFLNAEIPCGDWLMSIQVNNNRALYIFR